MLSSQMGQLTVLPLPASVPPTTARRIAQLVELWLSLKTSPHTRRAYAADTARFLAFVRKPLSWVTLADLQAWADTGAGKSPTCQPEPGAHGREDAAVLRPGDRLSAFQCGGRRQTPAQPR